MQEGLRGLPLLVLANKQDLPYALDAATVADALEMHHMRTRPWWVWSSCASWGWSVHGPPAPASVQRFWPRCTAASKVFLRHFRFRLCCRHVQACCAANSTGLREGLEWLSQAVAAQRQAATAAGRTAGRVPVETQVG